MGRWDDVKGGLAHREGIRQKHRSGEVGAARSATCARFCHASGGELEQIQFLSWGTFRCKRPNATLAASSGFDQPSMIALASGLIPEFGGGCGRVDDHTAQEFSGAVIPLPKRP